MPIEIAYTPALEAGTYEAVVTNVETRVNKDGNPYRWWEFTTEDGRTVSAISSMMVGPRSKAGQWIAALLGRTPVMGESVEVIGLPCLISVGVNEDGFSTIDTVVGRPKTVKAQRPFGAKQAEEMRASEQGEAHTPSQDEGLPF